MEALLRRELGCDFVKATGHSGGGCISQGQSYDTDRGRVFVKVNSKAEVFSFSSRVRPAPSAVGDDLSLTRCSPRPAFSPLLWGDQLRPVLRPFRDLSAFVLGVPSRGPSVGAVPPHVLLRGLLRCVFFPFIRHVCVWTLLAFVTIQDCVC
uniref:Protein-ribulosamine 3-kinase n=1 Tax=Felis catus TaxID=9685 RepID=A0ABI7WIF3_FELCA